MASNRRPDDIDELDDVEESEPLLMQADDTVIEMPNDERYIIILTNWAVQCCFFNFIAENGMAFSKKKVFNVL